MVLKNRVRSRPEDLCSKTNNPEKLGMHRDFSLRADINSHTLKEIAVNLSNFLAEEKTLTRSESVKLIYHQALLLAVANNFF